MNNKEMHDIHDFNRLSTLDQIKALRMAILTLPLNSPPTLLDQFAMTLIPGLMARYGENGYTDTGAIVEAYSLARTMMKTREAQPSA